MKKIISLVALFGCISANAAECNREIQVVQTKDTSFYREWKIDEDVDFFIDECTNIIRYTQRGNFNIEFFNQAMETVSWKNALGTPIYVDTDSMNVQIILYCIENKSIDKCPPGFSTEAIKDMPKRKFIVIGDYSSRKPKQELTETRLARIIDSTTNPKELSVQKMNPLIKSTHYTAVLEPEERILNGNDADKAEEARGQAKSGDGRLHILGYTLSMTQRTDDEAFANKALAKKSIGMCRSKKRHKLILPHDANGDDE